MKLKVKLVVHPPGEFPPLVHLEGYAKEVTGKGPSSYAAGAEAYDSWIASVDWRVSIKDIKVLHDKICQLDSNKSAFHARYVSILWTESMDHEDPISG